MRPFWKGGAPIIDRTMAFPLTNARHVSVCIQTEYEGKRFADSHVTDCLVCGSSVVQSGAFPTGLAEVLIVVNGFAVEIQHGAIGNQLCLANQVSDSNKQHGFENVA